MGTRNLSVISDTGPLIHLSEIGCSEFLIMFDKVYVPESVHQEYLKHRKDITPVCKLMRYPLNIQW